MIFALQYMKKKSAELNELKLNLQSATDWAISTDFGTCIGSQILYVSTYTVYVVIFSVLFVILNGFIRPV